MSDATVAKLLMLALSFCWGLSWSAMRIALDEVSPWGMRLIGYSIGAATLLLLLKAQGRSLAIPFSSPTGTEAIPEGSSSTSRASILTTSRGPRMGGTSTS